MKKKLHIFLSLAVIGVLFIVYKQWFFFNPLNGGDWRYYFPSNINSLSLFPSIWNTTFGNGLGANGSFAMSLLTYFNITTRFFFQYFHFPWVVIERVFWFWPFLIISFFSIRYLFKVVFSPSPFSLVASFLFLTNTYTLLLVGGGQMGVALAFSLMPLLIGLSIEYFSYKKDVNRKYIILLGFLFGIQIFFDMRIFYVTELILFLFILLVTFFYEKKIMFYKIFFLFIIPVILGILENASWIVPLVIYHTNPIQQLGSAYNSLDSVKFFSFATFENALSLLHPNWPENIFGKIYFMRPQFLLLPILAYSSLFFLEKKKQQRNFFILFFALIGLLGAFLGKGMQDPFGQVYGWLFLHFPGFSFFRDPTKWYMSVVISYSLLIPFFLTVIANKLKKTFSLKNSFFIIAIVFGLYTIFLLWPALFGKLTGSLTGHTVPIEYQQADKAVSNQKDFFRILWVPVIQRYGLFSNNHPEIAAQGFFNTSDEKKLLALLKKNSTQQLLQDAAVKYVIVPSDTDNEIFLSDRKYSEKVYQLYITELSHIPWLHKAYVFHKVIIYQVDNPKNHFYLLGNAGRITHTERKNPTSYTITLSGIKKGEAVVFSEGFDTNWIAQDINTKTIIAGKQWGLFNRFALSHSGEMTLHIYYQPQRWVVIGLLISGLVSITLLIFFFSPRFG